jgi:hypothetical protein
VPGAANVLIRFVEEARVSEVLIASEDYRNYVAISIGTAAATFSAVISLSQGVERPIGMWIVFSVAAALTIVFAGLAWRERNRKDNARTALAALAVVLPAQLNFSLSGGAVSVTSSGPGSEPIIQIDEGAIGDHSSS